MMNKFYYLIGQSLKKKIKSKWFLIINILLFVGIILFINIDSVISLFGGDFNDEKNVIVISDISDTNVYDTFSSSFNNNMEILNNDTKYKISFSNDNKKDIKKNIDEDDILINIIDNGNTIKAEVISLDKINNVFYQIITSSLNDTKKVVSLYRSGINIEDYNNINSNIEISREVINDDKSVDENLELIMGTIFPILILPIFMLSILLVQMIGAEINDEKTTKGMEIIISNVSPKVHFASKIISGNLFVIIQSLILGIAFGIGLIIRNNIGSEATNSILDFSMIIDTLTKTGIMDKLYFILPLTIVLMLLTFLTYSLVAGILASMTTNIEDYSQIQAPLAIISVVGYYLAIMSPMFDGSILIRIASYIPFISGVLSPALLMMGQINIYDVIISILVLILTNYLLIKYGIKVYKEGILNYSSKDVWKKIGKALKNK